MMKWLLYILISVVMIQIAYAGWGDLDYGTCRGGWGVCEAATPSQSGADTGGGGSFQSGAEAGPVTFAAQAALVNRDLCELDPDFSWLDLDSTCYKCTGWVATENDEIVCKTCNEGFERIGNECLIKSEGILSVNFVDRFLNRWFSDNPGLGMAVLILGVVVVGVIYVNRIEIIKKVKNVRRENF